MKIFLVILSGIAVIFILLVIAGYFLSGAMNEIVAESDKAAEEFATDANKEQCLDRYIDKYLACEEISCYMSVGAFGIICLQEASGSKQEFCADKPESQTDFYQGDWKSGLCKTRGLDTSDCLNVYKVIEPYCNN